MHIGTILSTDPEERRTALVPEVVAALIAAGHRVTVSPNVGAGAGFADDAYVEAGAVIGDPDDVDLLVVIGDPPSGTGGAVIGLMAPFDHDPATVATWAKGGRTLWAFEAIPRITRAQPMDALSSQATAAGYQAVLEAATHSDRFFPMLTTAAGTIRPSTVVVLGAGVAGLQAIATARRLGAVVWAFDVRKAAAEQVESLGGRFIDIDLEAQDESRSGGYATEVSDDEEQRILDGLAPHVAKADAVISTAAIPGRPAPLLITEAMIEQMRTGAVIVDLAAGTGGNCQLTEPGETVVRHGVTIIGDTDLVGRVSADASRMLARNARAFIDLVSGDDGAFAPDWDDEIVAGAAIARDGSIIHPRLVEQQ